MLNVYQMILEATGPVTMRRNSWAKGVAEVIGTSPPQSEWDAAKAPYFDNPTVYVLLKYGPGSPYVVEALSCPGTYGYARLGTAPGWWRHGLRYPVIGRHKGKRLELTEAGFRVR